MICPLLRRTQTATCRAVAGIPAVAPRAVVTAFCRGRFGDCPAYRFVRSAGSCLHPADFAAWVVRAVEPGGTEPRPNSD